MSREHSTANAARMLADVNYPTEYEQRVFLDALDGDPYHHKIGMNLLAMLAAARDLIEREKRYREALTRARRSHLIVDGDCWFSCPAAKDNDGERANCNDDAGDKCDCGADRVNALIDAALGGWP